MSGDRLAALFTPFTDSLLGSPRNLASLVCVLLGVLIVIDTALNVSSLVRHREGSVTADRRPPMQPSRPQDTQNLKSILAAHLFGTATDPAIEAADTQAALSLTGTIARPDPTRGYAIIAAAAAPSQIYAAGAAVPGGAMLLRVYDDRVILQRGGLEETLRLPKFLAPGAMAGAISVADARANPTAQDRYGDSILLHDPKPGEPVALVEPPPSAVTGALRVAALVVDKHLMGYSVVPRSGLEIPGLSPHDVITEINGVRLDNGATAGQMFDSLGQGGTVTVTVRAGDGLAQRTVDLSNLPAAITPKPKIRP